MTQLRRCLITLGIIAAACIVNRAYSQDTVDVTFHYRPGSVQAWKLVGEFTNWATNGISMSTTDNVEYTATARLVSTGQPGGYAPGGYEYKFYYPGISGAWPNDPLNPRSDNSQNGNSILYVRNPTIVQPATTDQIAAGSLTASVKTNNPVISAYLYPKINTSLDTGSISLSVDTMTFEGVGSLYDSASRRFQFTVPTHLPNGLHVAYLTAGTTVDSVSFTVSAGAVQILTHGGFSTLYSARTLIGSVQDTSVHRVNIVSGSGDTVQTTATVGKFSAVVNLHEGPNTYRALLDTPSVFLSDPITITRIVDHRPNAVVQVFAGPSNSVILSASTSTDPDGHHLTYEWYDDPRSPLGLTGRTDTAESVPKPDQPGEYYFSLIAKDSLGNADTTTSYFAVGSDSMLVVPTYASNPSWVKQARIYFLFPMAFSASQNLAGVTARLSYIKAMGFNVVWLMPVMKNASRIDQGYGPGYNIVDFYDVAPEYGTNADLKNLVDQAHTLGIRVILDITPNHTSREHPFSVDAHLYHQASPYWNWYQHVTDASDTRSLGWGIDPDGFVYYGGFGSQLLNYNWSDLDARAEMIRVYKYWVQQYGVDGFRFDVYWGPHNRYGEANWGIPVRTALKHVKPDIMILGETDGTGSGSENNYADASLGGCDLAYDWSLFHNAVANFGFTTSAMTNLWNNIYNSGYWPGPNARPLRFMENQDEDVIFYLNPSPSTYYDADATTAFRKTMPMASVIFAAPGVPELWNGQEIGWGYGISGAKEARNRSTIDWNFSGKDLLQPHYQKIAQIRGQFPAFWTQSIAAMNPQNSLVFAFSRPYANGNAVIAVNMSGVAQQSRLVLDYTNLVSVSDGVTYYANNVYADTTSAFQFSGGRDTLSVTLEPYGTAIFIIADSVIHMDYPPLTSVIESNESNAPLKFALSPNYPNPFNPSTTIRYEIPRTGRVSLRIYNLLGQEIADLVETIESSGSHAVVWRGVDDGGRVVGSGVYFARLQHEGNVQVRKLMLLR